MSSIKIYKRPNNGTRMPNRYYKTKSSDFFLILSLTYCVRSLILNTLKLISCWHGWQVLQLEKMHNSLQKWSWHVYCSIEMVGWGWSTKKSRLVFDHKWNFRLNENPWQRDIRSNRTEPKGLAVLCLRLVVEFLIFRTDDVSSYVIGMGLLP